MEFKITRASDMNYLYNARFETIEELRDFVISENVVRKSCVIWWDTMELLIYDSWIE